MAASPIALGFKSRAFAEAAARYIYIAEGDVWHDVLTGAALSRQSLDGLLAHAFDRSPSRELLKWHRTAKVQKLRYAPGIGDLILNHRDVWFLNSWQGCSLRPEPGEHPLIGELIERLLPNPEQRDHLMDVLAHLVQRPAAKVKHAVVLTGLPGCGKSSLASLASRLVGDHNAKTIDGHVLSGRWLNPFVDCQVLTIEEVQHGEKFEVTERLKTLITQAELTVEAKNRDFFTARTPNLVFILSNDRRPLALSRGSRREWMPDYVDAVPEDRFFAAYHAALATELPRFLGELMGRDVNGFNADAPPPMTAAKVEAIEDSRSNLVVQLEEFIATRGQRFDRDVVLLAEVAVELRCAGQPASENQVRKALKQIGGRSCVNQVAPHPRWVGSPRAWAIRNHRQWVDATKSELRDHLVGSDRSDQSTGAPARPSLRAIL